MRTGVINHSRAVWVLTSVWVGLLIGCTVETSEEDLSVTDLRQALSSSELFVTEIAQKTDYAGSIADKVEVYCTAASGCPAFRLCDPTSTGTIACSAVQGALASGARAVISRGTSITTSSYEQVWIENCSGACTEVVGTRVNGPFSCEDGAAIARKDCAASSFGACGAPDLGRGVACSVGACGDGTCGSSETCSTCAADCGACVSAEPFTYTVSFSKNQHGVASSTCTSATCSALKSLIDSATSSIEFAVYGVRAQQAIIDALANAQARGVNVRGVVDTENGACGSQGTYTYPDTPLLISALRPGAVVCDSGSGYSYIMHNKFFVFDGAKVWTGSTNVSDTETGGELSANVVFVATSRQLAAIYQTEFEEMHAGLCHRNKTDNTTHVLGPSRWTDGTTSVESYFAPTDDAATHAMLALINGAVTNIDVAIFFLTDDAIGDALVAAKGRGVQVRVILDATGAPSVGSEMDKLCSAGIPLKVENWPGKEHSKWGVADGKAVVLGSQNWTAAGNSNNDENTLYIKNASLAGAFVTEFARQWAALAGVSTCVLTAAEGSGAPGSCSDGVDNDYDTYVDCNDFGCTDDPACRPAENTPAQCKDGLDNDDDDLIDCSDSGCAGVGVCAVLVNECLPAPVSGPEWIELYNPSSISVDVSGTYVDDMSGGSSPDILPSGSVVPAKGFLLVNLNGFKLNNTGTDQCRLLNTDQREINRITYSSAPSGKSRARMPNGSSTLSWDATPTPGATNQ